MATTSLLTKYDARNFKQYIITLESKCMKTQEGAQVLLGLYKDPIRELEAVDKTNYDRITALITAHNQNRNAALPEGNIVMPTAKVFQEDPVAQGKLFILMMNNTNNFDADRKTKTIKAMQD
jgi:hypothetical protein